MFNIQVIKKGRRTSPPANYYSIQTNGSVSDGCGYIPSIAAYGTYADFTIEMWVSRGVWTANFSRIFDFGFNNGFTITRNGVTDQVALFIMYSSLAAQINSSSDLSQDVWTHVACVRSGSTAYIYFNGTEVGTGTVSSSTFSYSAFSTLGIAFNNSTTPDTEHTTLKMTDIRIWKEARSQAQIAANMNTHLIGNETNLAGNWQFIDGSLDDSTANNNSVVLEAAATMVTDNPY